MTSKRHFGIFLVQIKLVKRIVYVSLSTLLLFQSVIAYRYAHPGCRFACPGLCAPLGLQPVLAKSGIKMVRSKTTGQTYLSTR